MPYLVEKVYSWRGLRTQDLFIYKAFSFHGWLIVFLLLPDFSKEVNKEVSVDWVVVYWEVCWEEIGLFNLLLWLSTAEHTEMRVLRSLR